MRTSTYRSEASSILQDQDDEIELRLDSATVRRIVEQRVETTKVTLRLAPDIPFRIPQFEDVSGQDVAACFCDLLSGHAAMKALVTLSNGNLKALFRKLRLMARSEAFSDTFIVRELLERTAVAEHRRGKHKTWIFYSLLLGNHSGTFKRDPDARKANIVNLFDSSTSGEYPFRYFIRLNLLMYLYKQWRLLRDPTHFINVADLHRKFTGAFGTLVSASLFVDALFALVESELVLMESCRRYSADTIMPRAFSDSVQISSAGCFYFENLLHKIEYPYYIKDDIDWWLTELPKDLRPAHRDHAQPVKFKAVIAAIELLLKAEYDLLTTLKAHWGVSRGGKDALERYRDHFSPHGLPEPVGVSFCSALLLSYRRFMLDRTQGRAFHQDIEARLEEIDTWCEGNEGVIATYVSTR